MYSVFSGTSTAPKSSGIQLKGKGRRTDPLGSLLLAQDPDLCSFISTQQHSLQAPFILLPT